MNISLIHNVHVHRKVTEEKDFIVCLLFPIASGILPDGVDYFLYL